MSVFRVDTLEHVESDREIRISRINIDNVIDPMRRDEIKDFFYKIAVWIDNGKPMSVLHILDHHVLQHGRFAHAGFADDVHVASPVIELNAELLLLVAEVRSRKIDNVASLFHRYIGRFGGGAPFCSVTWASDGGAAVICCAAGCTPAGSEGGDSGSS